MARDPDLDLLKAIRLLAYDAVTRKGSEYILRFIFRWYSREFSVPLPQVDEIPLEDVLQAFFECRYEQMDEHEREDEESKLRETQPERLEREAREKRESEDDDDFLREAIAEARRANADAARGPRDLDEPIDPDLGRRVALPIMGEKLPQSFQEVADKADAKLKEIPPDIDVKFVGEGELDLDDWDICGPPPKKD